MEWIYCHDAIPDDQPIPVWVLRRQASEATAGYFGNLGDGLGPAFTDERGHIIDDPYAWMARTSDRKPPESPFKPGVRLERCPSGRPHLWAKVGSGEHAPTQEGGLLTCAYCGEER